MTIFFVDMKSLGDIKAPVANYVDCYHDKFRELLMTKSEWLSTALEHIEKSEGKRIRPIVATLVGCMINENLSPYTVDAAVVLELIHTATLIHDDVIDESLQRRGFSSLNAIFDNRVAVLIGDFLFSSALIGAVACNDIRVVSLVSRAGRELTEGEIRQMETAESALLSEEVYFDIIRQKTAVLFRSCAEVACYTNNASNEDIDKLARMGELIGLAFQIRDDIFDYYSDDIGKPTGNDIREGKITLPLLYALLHHSADDEIENVRKIINNRDFSDANISYVIDFAKRKKGIEYAQQKMTSLVNEAKDILMSYPDTVFRQSLMSLADYVVQRKK